jgi:hypothetical protein
MHATVRAVFVLLLPFLASSLVGCAKYNELVDKDQICQQMWANVETQVQRRYDLVPNLVAAVKGSVAHEEKTLEAVTRAREEYNKAVGEYNATLGKIGGQIVNKATGRPFKPRAYFTASAGAETAPTVAF